MAAPKHTGDTISAIATGQGAVGIVRISGQNALPIAAGVLAKKAQALPDRQLVHGWAHDVSGQRIDEVLAVYMAGPRSYTGEDVVEISGHGGSANMARLLRATLERGARSAEPGEFTRRAVLNQKIDLTRAEAVLAVVNASTDRALRVAQNNLQGALGQKIASMRQSLTELLADIEARVDFPEEGLQYSEKAHFNQLLQAFSEDCQRLLASFAQSRVYSEGIDVALRGTVNAGKSSLLNALTGIERSIVSAEPGTTRDYVEATVVWQGIPVTLIDTAGERQSSDQVETRGIDLGKKRADAADVEVWLVPVGETPRAETRLDTAENRHVIFVQSKSDMTTLAPVPGVDVAISVKTGQGLTELKDVIVKKFLSGMSGDWEGTTLSSARQESLVRSAQTAAAAAQKLLEENGPMELLAFEIRHALHQLAEVQGDEVGEEVLDALFARFCIGK